MNYLFSKNNLFVIDFCYYVHFIENIYTNPLLKKKRNRLYSSFSNLIQYSITRFFLLRVPYGNQR